LEANNMKCTANYKLHEADNRKCAVNYKKETADTRHKLAGIIMGALITL
jgi:hypothetical protein